MVEENCITRSFIICILHQTLIMILMLKSMRWEGYVAHNVLIIKRKNLEDLDADEPIILKWNLKKKGRRVRSGLIWLRIMFSSRFLRTGYCTFGFNKSRVLLLLWN
jgi:hypothetical protein